MDGRKLESSVLRRTSHAGDEDIRRVQVSRTGDDESFEVNKGRAGQSDYVLLAQSKSHSSLLMHIINCWWVWATKIGR